ncbi:MAG: hypothetical protein HQP61_11650 [Peptococcaceae bacterium]|nr:hypothetical protein [Candidatus Syntrophopropionicum ammoniitolerans]
MTITVNLDEIIEALETQTEEISNFLDLKTGEVLFITDEEFQAAENGEPLDGFPDWQQESILTAREILEKDHYIPLPSRYDIDEYSIMERFCLSVTDEELQNILFNAIRSRGAFRRFKDNIHRHGIAEDWYKYRDEAFKQQAIDWCKANDIKYK